MGCGLNQPAPDLLTPVRAAAAIWTWAPGHPFDPSYTDGRLGAALTRHLQQQQQRRRPEQQQQAGRQRDRQRQPQPAGAVVANCGVISASDARWRAVPCALPALPSACRLQNASLGAADGGWVVGDGGAERGACPEGTLYDLPRHPRENYLLAAALQRAGHEAAWLPVHGPEWSTDGWPARRQQRQPTNKRQLLVHGALPAAGGLAGLAALVAAAVVGRRALLRRRSPELYQALAPEPQA